MGRREESGKRRILPTFLSLNDNLCPPEPSVRFPNLEGGVGYFDSLLGRKRDPTLRDHFPFTRYDSWGPRW